MKKTHPDQDPQTEMIDAEEVTAAVMPVLRFGGNYAYACNLLNS